MRPLAILSAITLTSCAGSTLIESRPSGADLYLDGQFVGKTPFEMTDHKRFGAVTAVHLEAPGYEPLDDGIVRNEALNWGVVLGSIFLVGIPLLWAGEYQPRHEFDLAPGGYLAYYVDQLTFVPGQPPPALAPYSPGNEPPRVAHGADLAADTAKMRATGYVEIGVSTFNDAAMLPAHSEDLARAVAVEKHAAVVLLYQTFTGTVTYDVPYTVDNQSVTTWSNGERTHTRTTDNYATATRTANQDRYDYTATFWAKRAN